MPRHELIVDVGQVEVAEEHSPSASSRETAPASSRVPLGLSSVPESAERDGGKPVAEGERLRSRVQQHAPLKRSPSLSRR